jgi:hypothetical protein
MVGCSHFSNPLTFSKVSRRTNRFAVSYSPTSPPTLTERSNGPMPTPSSGRT